METNFKPGTSVRFGIAPNSQIGEVEAYEGEGWYIVIFEEPGESIKRVMVHEDDLYPVEP